MPYTGYTVRYQMRRNFDWYTIGTFPTDVLAEHVARLAMRLTGRAVAIVAITDPTGNVWPVVNR